MDAEGFAAFWQSYPRRVGKLAAQKAYQKARTLATADEIIEGVAQFNAHLPDDVQFIAYPASWLNAGRWSDEYDEPVKPTTASDWWEDCKVIHGGTCDKRWNHETKKRA